jgi:hypothetical protein
MTRESRVFSSMPNLQFWIFRLSFIIHTKVADGSHIECWGEKFERSRGQYQRTHHAFAGGGYHLLIARAERLDVWEIIERGDQQVKEDVMWFEQILEEKGSESRRSFH